MELEMFYNTLQPGKTAIGNFSQPNTEKYLVRMVDVFTYSDSPMTSVKVINAYIYHVPMLFPVFLLVVNNVTSCT